MPRTPALVPPSAPVVPAYPSQMERLGLLDEILELIEENGGGGGGVSDWGDIGGTLADQTDLAAALAAKAPLVSPTFTGTPLLTTTPGAGDNSHKLADTAYVDRAIANLVDSSPSALNTLNELAAALGNDASFATTVTNALGAKAPIASPTFTGTVTITTVSGADNSTKAASTAWVRGFTAPVTNDGSGHYSFGGSTVLDLGDGSSPATLSVLGGLGVSANIQSAFFNTATTITELQNQNVMLWQHTHADGAAAAGFIGNVGTILPSATLTKSAYVGAIGFQNYNGSSPTWAYNGYVFFSTSMPYYTDGSNIPVSGSALKAPPIGLFRESSYTPPGGSSDNAWHVVPFFSHDANWEFYFRDYAANPIVYIPRSNVNGSQNFWFYQTSSSANGSGTGAQLIVATHDSVYTILNSISANLSYKVYPTSGGWVGTNGSGGFMVGATHASGAIRFVTGGEETTNERLRIDASGNFIFKNSVTSAPSVSLGNGQYHFTVYETGGVAKVRFRYKLADGSATVTGDVTLS